ncbi:MAG: insulinase family protein [Gammaproteobacteria bacterium]|nr:insulinase family protein [Gammaproteobacteria bacterium]
MRIVTNLSLFISIFFSVTAFAADQATQEYHLDNGLTLVVKEDHRAPVVISEVWYKVGSGYEILGYTGLSHMLEHLMFKGTPAHPGSTFLEQITQNGGQLNAFTTRDFTTYYEMLSADKLTLSFQLEADRMANLSLSPTTFDSEHQVVIEERQLRTVNDPQALTYERFIAAALVANPYQNPTVGWPSDLKHMTNKDAQNWYHHWYGPNNAIVVVVGDVKPDDVYQLAKTTFGPLKPIKMMQIKPHDSIKPLGARKIIVKAPAKLPYLIMGFNTPSVVTAQQKWEPYALEVLSGILAGSDSSRLQQDLVRDKQIASEVDVDYDTYTRLSGLLTIGATPSQGHTIGDLRTAIFAEIKQLQTTPISDQELNRIKTQVIANNIYSQDSIDYEAYLIGSLESVGLSWQEVDNYETQIRAVTPQQVQAVAKKYLNHDNSTTAELVPLPTNNTPIPQGSIQGARNVQ